MRLPGPSGPTREDFPRGNTGKCQDVIGRDLSQRFILVFGGNRQLLAWSKKFLATGSLGPADFFLVQPTFLGCSPCFFPLRSWGYRGCHADEFFIARNSKWQSLPSLLVDYIKVEESRQELACAHGR